MVERAKHYLLRATLQTKLEAPPTDPLRCFEANGFNLGEIWLTKSIAWCLIGPSTAWKPMWACPVYLPPYSKWFVVCWHHFKKRLEFAVLVCTVWLGPCTSIEPPHIQGICFLKCRISRSFRWRAAEGHKSPNNILAIRKWTRPMKTRTLGVLRLVWLQYYLPLGSILLGNSFVSFGREKPFSGDILHHLHTFLAFINTLSSKLHFLTHLWVPQCAAEQWIRMGLKFIKLSSYCGNCSSLHWVPCFAVLNELPVLNISNIASYVSRWGAERVTVQSQLQCTRSYFNVLFYLLYTI